MIAGGTDRARREEMPGSKVTSAPRAPVPARANTGRWAGLSTWCGVRSEPACRGGGRARDARSILDRAASLLPSAPVARIDPSARQRASAAEGLPQKGCRRRRREGGRRRRRAASRAARGRVRGVRGTASAGCGSACGGSRASGGRRWSTPSVRAPGPFGPTDATDPIAWSTCLSPPPRPPRASTPSAAGAPRLHKSCREGRPQSKGRSRVSGRARRDMRVRGGRGHLSERPGWPSGAPIS